jgi:hypothetical protein
MREINCSHKKILEVLMFFLNLNLNLNLAILKMRIVVSLFPRLLFLPKNGINIPLFIREVNE